MRCGAAIALALVVLSTAGCGSGGLSRKDLQKQAKAIQSLAAEGALVADGVADARMTETFSRVHTKYLEEAARKVQTKLASARASGSIDEKRSSALQLAGRVADELAELHGAPEDRALARRVRSQLQDDVGAAERLAK
jgi:septum formation inhibitor MinC